MQAKLLVSFIIGVFLSVSSFVEAAEIQIDATGNITLNGTCEGIDPSALCGPFTSSFVINTNELSLSPGETLGIQYSEVRPRPVGSLSISGTEIHDPLMVLIYDDYDTGGGVLRDRLSINFEPIKLEWLFPITSWSSRTDLAGFVNSVLTISDSTTSTLAICQLCDGNNLSTIFTGTFQFTAEVSQVPIPASLWLFGSGLIGLIGIARRKQPERYL